MKSFMTSATAKGYVVVGPRPVEWGKIDRINKELLVQFFKNVRYLMKTRQISQRNMERDIKCALGFDISRGAALKYVKNPAYVNASLSYLTVYCIYFQEPIWRMMRSDYETDGYLGNYTNMGCTI